jgi:hypothetical protein
VSADVELSSETESPLFVTDMLCCPRCLERHESIMFTRFKVPIKADEQAIKRTIYYWAMCPRYNEPILRERKDR